MAIPIASALRSAGRFAVRNPSALFNMARHALSFRLAVPIDAVRWFIDNQAPGKNKPTDVTVVASPPGITLGASLDLVGTAVRASVTVFVEDLKMGENQLETTLRLADVDLTLLADSQTDLAALLKAKALDLSKPGNLANFMPKRPPVLVHAKDDKIVLDLLQDQKIATHPRVQQILKTVAPVVVVRGIHTEGDMIILNLKAKPSGFRRAIAAARRLPA